MSDAEEYRDVIATMEGLRSKFVIAYRHAECLLKNGDRAEIMVRPALDQIKAQQRKFLKDIVFGQIAEQVQLPVFDLHGRDTGRRERFDKAVWAEKFRRDLLGSKHEMQRMPGAKKATPVKVRISTESLGVKAYSEYTDRCIDHAVVEYGVEFHFTRDERESVRYSARRGKSQ
jgi:hypothetical protein